MVLQSITQSTYSHQAPQQERGARVRLCNYVKFKVGENLPPAMKIVTRIVQQTKAIVAKHTTGILF